MAEEEKTQNKMRLVVLNGEEVGDRRPPGGGGGAGGEGEAAGEPVWCSDDMLAARLSAALGEDWRCAAESGDWYRWTGEVWEKDEKRKVYTRSRQVCRGVSLEVDTAKLARDVSSKTRIYAAVKLAGEDPRHVIALEEFDKDNHLLNTPSGIIDLRTGQLQPHDRAAKMTRMTAAGPDGDCPRWRTFLEQITGGNSELRRFLQRMVGYCLTGGIEEHAFFFLYGPGGRGKGVFLNTIARLLSGYATTAAMDLFTVATGERHSATLAMLHNARLVTASETDEARRWDEAKLKAITGGDPVTANFMRGNPFTFWPRFKLVLSGNHRPRLRSADTGMRRRLHVVPFKHKPPAVDLMLPELLIAELGGILRWAVEGELERRRIGLAPPPVVRQATDEYFEAENTIGRWVAERCKLGSQETGLTKVLYQDFKSWAARVGEFVVSERIFAEKLSLLEQLERWRDAKGQRGFAGLALKEGQAELFAVKPTTPRGEGVRDVNGLLPGGIDPEDEYER
jgi:putative DNA primase/helicase